MGQICQRQKSKDQEHKKKKYLSMPAISKYTLQEDIYQIYNVQEKILGAGSFGTVRIATHKISGEYAQTQKYAIKTINKKKIENFNDLRQEVEILTTVDHPNIIKFYETFEDQQYFHIVMQLCTGGELFDYIVEQQVISEKKAASLMRQMMSAVNYLHQIDICHRDLKPENFLFESKEVDAHICLIDFGLSIKFGKEKLMESIVGTPYYVAPEVLQDKQYGPNCDIWSLGVILYVMLCGTYPFGGIDESEITNQIQAKDLLSKLLTKNPEERISIEEALKHKWFTQNYEKEIKIDPAIFHNMKQYQNKTKLYKQLLNISVRHFSTNEIKALREQFEAIDTSLSGFIELDELEKAIKQAGTQYSQKEVEDLLASMDINHDGKINYTEFIVATLDQKVALNKQKQWLLFQKLDKNNSGFISESELLEAFNKIGQPIKLLQLREMMFSEGIISVQGISFKLFCKILDSETINEYKLAKRKKRNQKLKT